MALTAQEIEALMPDCTELLSDEPEMESSLHYTQLLILVTCLEWLWRDQEDFFIGANLSIYYSRQQLKNRDLMQNQSRMRADMLSGTGVACPLAGTCDLAADVG
ncbi:MAG: hypothetical protein ACKPGB_18110, partial [Dolichospermum sp.]